MNGPRNSGRLGFSLVESVAATFILLTAILLTFQLFHSGMHYFRWVEEKNLATNIADQRLAQIRNWARNQNNWSSYPNGPDPDHPEYTLTVVMADRTTASPCLELDKNFSDPREMTKTCKRVTVKVTWSHGSVELHSLVSDRDNRGWSSSAPIQIQGTIPLEVHPATPVPLSAKAYDASNNELKDLFFTWSVEPRDPDPALATVNPSRDGRSANFVNTSRRPYGTQSASAGFCRVVVRAMYNGVERVGYTADIKLVDI